MKIYFLHRWRVFWLYALIMSVLGAYAWHLNGEKLRQQERYLSLDRTLQQARDIACKYNEITFRDIEQNDEAHQCLYNDSLLAQAKCVQRTLEDFSRFVEKELESAYHAERDSLLPEGSFRFFKNVLTDPAQLDSLRQKRAVLADSLRFFAQRSPELLASLEKDFSDADWAAAENILQNGRDDQKTLLLHCLPARYTAAAGPALRFLKSQMWGGHIPMKGLMPIISSRQSCARAGEVFRGDFFAAAYSTHTDNLTMFVNGVQLPIEQGLGKFKHVYRTPGEKKLEVRINVTNPFTHEVMTYIKEFSIEICE